VRSWYRNLDYATLLIWLGLVSIGLVAIYSIVRGPASYYLLQSVQQNFERQLIWAIISAGALTFVLLLSVRFLQSISYLVYLVCIGLLVAALLFGREINGARAWLMIGPMALQTGTVAALGTMMALARFISNKPPNASHFRYALVTVVIVTLPAVLMVLQNDTGTALPLLATIPVMLLWGGLPIPIVMILVAPAIAGYLAIVSPPLALVFSIVFTVAIFWQTRRAIITAVGALASGGVALAVYEALTDLLAPHQVARIVSFNDPEAYRMTSGFHVIQSKAAIGSGGLFGKGFMQGTQTQGAYVPEQWTDFIFCVVGEEFGFVGGFLVLALFALMMIRLVSLGNRARHPYAGLFSVGVSAIFLTHVIINIGMTLGAMPIIGIPLPFLSYGGSALLIHTVMVAIVLNLYMRRDDFSLFS
jgi:rod shape determining protein RodA